MIETKENNTLKAWATGKLAMFALGLGVAYGLYKTGLIQKLKDKLFTKPKEAE